MVVDARRVSCPSSDAAVVLGPVIGVVTSTTAVVLVEVSHVTTLTCVLTDPLSQHCATLRRRAAAGKPLSFYMTGLRPCTRYEVRSASLRTTLCRLSAEGLSVVCIVFW